MTENYEEMTPNIRKIRTQTNENQNKTQEHTEEITSEGKLVKFNEACNQGIIKPGMRVVFENPNFGPIFLSKEETGLSVDQNCGGEIHNGIVYNDADGYHIAIPIIGETMLFGVRGRFGYANFRSIYSKVTYKIMQPYFEKSISIAGVAEECFKKLFNSGYIFQSYLLNYYHMYFYEGINSYSRGIYLLVNGNARHYSLDGASTHYAHLFISITLNDDEKICLKNARKIEINNYYNFKSSPFSTYVEIRRRN